MASSSSAPWSCTATPSVAQVHEASSSRASTVANASSPSEDEISDEG
jgi:hypothetical protein